MALFAMKALMFLKALVVFILKIIFKPLAGIGRFFYWLLVLPIYRFYLLVGKKFGLSKSKQDRVLAAILINKKIAHLILAGLTILFVYFNMTSAKGVLSSEDVVGKTLVSKVVFDESTQDQILIEEKAGAAPLVVANNDYWSKGSYWKPPLAFDYTSDEDLELGDEIVQEPTEEQPVARSEIVNYTVKPGDSIGSIASHFGISVNSILWENGLTAKSYIKPGDQLKILPVSGVTYAVARGDTLARIAGKFGVSADSIMKANGLASANQIKLGEKLVIPGGKKLLNTSVANNQQGRPTAGSSVVTAPQAGVRPVSGAKLNWPAQGRITQYYSWRHTGLDIANHIGTPIYAADAGTVVTAGWNNGGYGYQVVIDHGNGMLTRYAHLSKFAVSAGDQVGKGQYIAAMGSTGHSTGPHCHFEVIRGGKRYNPLSYLGY